MNRLPSLLTVLVLLAPAAAAGGLQKHRVPAGARWLAHLDVEAMKTSKLFAAVREESAKDGSDDMEEGLAEFRAFAGLDPTQDFQSVTIYSASASEEGCVALLAGNAKIDLALEKLRTMENYHTTPAQDYVFHTWGGDGETWYAYVHRASSEERVVVASQDKAELSRGIAVLEKKGESLADAAAPALRATPAAGSILFATAGGNLKELGEIEPVSAVARLAKTLVVDVGEDRGDLDVRVSIDTRSPEDAQRIHQVLQGAVALVGLVGGDGQEAVRSTLQRLVEALRITVSNNRVDAVFRYDVDALLEELGALEALEEHHGAGKHHRPHKHHEDHEEDEDQGDDR